MSPLKHLFRIIGLYLLAAAVFALPAAVVWPWGGPPTLDFIAWKMLATAFPSILSAVALALALTGAVQAAPLLGFWGRPDALIQQMKRDLDSPKSWKRRRVLQVLADYHGHPFGRVICWPLSLQGPAQIRNMILLYKEWLRISKDFARDKALLPHIVRRMQSPAKIVAWNRLCGVRVGGFRRLLRGPLPPVPADRLVTELRGRVEGALRQMADIINEAQPGQRADAEARIRDVVGALVWDALSWTVCIALDDAAAGDETRVPPAGPFGRAVDAALDGANEAVKDAILDVGIDDEEQAPYPERRPLPPVAPDRLAAALRVHIDKTVAAVVERVNGGQNLEEIASAQEEISRLFETLTGTTLELAAGLRVDAAAEKLPWSAAQGAWARRLRRMAALDSVVEPQAGPDR